MSEAPERPLAQVRLIRFFPWILFLVGLGIRLVGIGWGLPNGLHNQSYHPDEIVNWGYAQEIEPQSLDFAPGFYSYGTLYLTLLRVASDVVGGYGGGIDPARPESVWSFVGNGILAGRILNAIFGALTGVFVFLLCRRWMKPLAASLAGLAIAFAPGFTVHSRFVTVDVLATMLVAASALVASRLLAAESEEALDAKQTLKLVLWAGLLAGLSAGTKYTGGLAILTVLAVLAIGKRPGWGRLALAAVGACLVGFLVSTPGCLTEPDKFWAGFTYEIAHSAQGHGLVFVGLGSGFAVQIYNMIEGYGGLLLLASVVGVALAPKRLRPVMWPLLAFALPYYVVIGRSEIMFLRYSFPLLVLLAVGFGALAEWGFERGERVGRPLVAGLMLILGGVPIWGGLRSAGVMAAYMAGADPRDEAARFLKEQVAKSPETKVGIVSDPWFQTPPLFPDSTQPRARFMQNYDQTMAEMSAAGMVQYVPENPAERFDWDVRLLDDVKPSLVVFSSFDVEPLARLAERSGLAPEVQLQVDRYKTFLAALRRDYALDRTFGGGLPPIHDLEYVRPWIWVWKRK